MPEFGEPIPQQRKQRSVSQKQSSTYQQNVISQPQQAGGDLVSTINNGANTIIEGYKSLYAENQVIAIALVCTLLFVPLLLCCGLPLLVTKPPSQPKKRTSTRSTSEKGRHQHRRKRKIVYEYSDGEEEEVVEDKHLKTN